MSFLKGSSSVFVFQIKSAPDFQVMLAAGKRSFSERESFTRIGSLEHEPDGLTVGELLPLGFRVDLKKAPAKLVKIQLAQKVEEIKAQGRKVSAQHKRELKEAIVEELQRQALPSIQSADLVFDGARLYVFGSAAMADRIVRIVHEAGGELEPVTVSESSTVLKLYSIVMDGYRRADMADGNGYLLIADRVSLLDTMGMSTATTNPAIAQAEVRENPDEYAVTQCLIEVRTDPASSGEDRIIGHARVKLPTSVGSGITLAIKPPVSEGADDDAKILDRFAGFKRIFEILEKALA